jgi:stage II sporulation protein E
VVLTFAEKATYVAEFASAQIACQDNKLCGDAFQTWSDRRGTAHVILSDGMGSGGNAAVDSAMASGLLTPADPGGNQP